MSLPLFRGAEGGDAEQGLTGESFKQWLIFGRFHDRNKVVREVLSYGHELGNTGPGDAEMVTSGGLGSLRVFYQIFPHLDGHGYDILVDWRRRQGPGGQGIV